MTESLFALLRSGTHCSGRSVTLSPAAAPPTFQFMLRNGNHRALSEMEMLVYINCSSNEVELLAIRVLAT